MDVTISMNIRVKGLVEEKEIPFSKNANQEIHLAFNNSYILIQRYKSNILKYVDSFGQLKKEYLLDDIITDFQILDKEKIMVLMRSKNEIVIIDLKKQQESRTYFSLIGDYIKLFYFCESKLICILEETQPQQQKIQSKIRMTYLKVDDIKNIFVEYQFISKYQNGNSQFNTCDKIGNYHSLLYFLKDHGQDQIQIIFHDILIINGQPKSRIRTVFFTQKKFQKKKKLNLSIWEVRQDQLFIVPNFLHYLILIINYQGQILQRLMLDPIFVQQDIKVMGAKKFSYCIESVFLKKFLCICYILDHPDATEKWKEQINEISEKFKKSVHQIVNMFFIDIDTLNAINSVIVQQNEEYSAHKTLSFDSENPSILVKISFQNRVHQEGQEQIAKIKKVWHVDLKDIFMFFLLHLNQDLDDDLLKQALQLLPNSQ